MLAGADHVSVIDVFEGAADKFCGALAGPSGVTETMVLQPLTGP